MTSITTHRTIDPDFALHRYTVRPMPQSREYLSSALHLCQVISFRPIAKEFGFPPELRLVRAPRQPMSVVTHRANDSSLQADFYCPVLLALTGVPNRLHLFPPDNHDGLPVRVIVGP